MTLFYYSTKGATDDEKLGFLMNTIDTTSCGLIIPEIMGDDCSLRKCIKRILSTLWRQKTDCNKENLFLIP